MLFHTKLFTVLHSCGIRGNLLHGYVIFFTGRTHCTKVGTKLSDFLALISGVVQGSVIGPMMFLIFINELVWLLDKYGVKVKLFADDVKLYLRIVNDVDILVLQDELTAVYKWANEWQLSVSIENCYILLLGKATNQVVLSVGNSVLLVVQSCHDLGITVTHDLSFRRTSFGKRSFSTAAPSVWNSLPVSVQNCDTLTLFKSRLKAHLFSSVYAS